MDERVKDLGEFGLIGRLTGGLPVGDGVVVGAGDDCAVVRFGEREVLLSCDASLEGRHFDKAYMPAEAIGWRAMASALSDIAAMGGVARFAVVTLGLPPELEVAFVEELYRGLAEAAAEAGAAIVGGDTAASEWGIVIDVTVLGEPVGGRYVLRTGAKAGDVLAVTGYPGRAAAGLLALRRGVDAPALVEAFLRPVPRLAAGQWLAQRPEVHAMIDLSDGLLADARHVAEASGVGLDITRAGLPIAEALRAAAKELGFGPADLVLGGGEDYELACAVDADEFDAVRAAFEEAQGLALHAAGRFTAKEDGIVLDGAPAPHLGFEHFG